MEKGRGGNKKQQMGDNRRQESRFLGNLVVKRGGITIYPKYNINETQDSSYNNKTLNLPVKKAG